MSVDEPTLTVARLGRLLENTSDVELSLPQYRVLGLLSTGVRPTTRHDLVSSRYAKLLPSV